MARFCGSKQIGVSGLYRPTATAKNIDFPTRVETCLELVADGAPTVAVLACIDRRLAVTILGRSRKGGPQSAVSPESGGTGLLDAGLGKLQVEVCGQGPFLKRG
jgi:hypothetical protein